MRAAALNDRSAATARSAIRCRSSTPCQLDSTVPTCDTCDDVQVVAIVRSTRGRIARDVQEAQEGFRSSHRAFRNQAVEDVVPLPLTADELRLGEPVEVLRDGRLTEVEEL